MNIKVLYHSSTGNTQKIANCIAGVFNICAEQIKEDIARKIIEPIDMLFIGDGIYFGKPNKNISNFISEIDPKLIKNVAVFGTCGGQVKIGQDIKALFENKCINVIEETFVCKAQSWFFINRNHPNEEDFNNAIEFAKRVVDGIKIN